MLPTECRQTKRKAQKCWKSNIFESPIQVEATGFEPTPSASETQMGGGPVFQYRGLPPLFLFARAFLLGDDFLSYDLDAAAKHTRNNFLRRSLLLRLLEVYRLSLLISVLVCLLILPDFSKNHGSKFPETLYFPDFREFRYAHFGRFRHS